jgi:hypothetical protein
MPRTRDRQSKKKIAGVDQCVLFLSRVFPENQNGNWTHGNRFHAFEISVLLTMCHAFTLRVRLSICRMPLERSWKVKKLRRLAYF